MTEWVYEWLDCSSWINGDGGVHSQMSGWVTREVPGWMEMNGMWQNMI